MGAGLLFMTPEVSVKLGLSGKRGRCVEGERESWLGRCYRISMCGGADHQSRVIFFPLSWATSWELAQRMASLDS